MKAFRVATFNINYFCGGNDSVNANKVKTTILESKVDVVCLQESNAKWEDYLTNQPEITNAYPHIHFHNHTNPWGGFAILSKYPFDDDVSVLPETDRGWYPAGCVTLRIPTAPSLDALLQILIVHLRAPLEWSPKPNCFGCRANWIGGYFSKRVKAKRLHEIATFAKALSPNDIPSLVVGDFNERGAASPCIQYLEEKLQFTNLPKKAYGGGCGCHAKNSWRLDLGPCTLLSLDYDHILYSKQSLKPVEDSALVHSDSGSDHQLVSAGFIFLESSDRW